MPSAEVLKRAQAYAGRSFEGNLADILLPYGFREPVKRPRFWRVRHFFRPGQVNPLRLKPLFDVVRRQGMLDPVQAQGVRIDSSRLPSGFLEGFRERDCQSLDCAECGYCERIAESAVTIDPELRR